MGDLRYAIRGLLRNPGFALVAVLLLALGIGANSVIFSALDVVILRPLEVKNPRDLVRLVEKRPQLGTRSILPFTFYEALRDHTTKLSEIAGEADLPAAMSEPGLPKEVQVHLPTPEFFDLLGVQALYGRTLTANDALENPGDPPAVLSYGFWKRQFDSDPRAVGRNIVLNKHRFVVVGIMPREFNGVSIDTAPDVRVPLRALPLLSPEKYWRADTGYLELIGRLKPGVTSEQARREQARAECLAIWNAVPEKPKIMSVDTATFDLDPLEHGVSILRDRFGGALKLLIASVGVLLLMVCANVAGLLLARGASRRQEIAVRLAIGATRWRLARQMLSESFLLTILGAMGGIAIAFVSAPLLVRWLPQMRDFSTRPLVLSLQLGPDWRVLLFSFAISAVAAALAGMAPAISASRTSLESVLRSARSSGGWRGRQVLVVFQIALCTLLLAGAGLLIRTFERLQNLNIGLDRDHIITFTANPFLSGYTPEQAAALVKNLTERVRTLPGVISVATATRGVMRGSGVKMTIAPVGQKTTRADFLNTSLNSVSLEYFDTMGIHMLEGRGFLPSDERKEKPHYVVVNQAFARRFFPNVEPVGKRFGGGAEGEAKPDYEIIGVVSDAKYRSLREPMTPTFYSLSTSGDYFHLMVRTRTRPESMMEPVRQALAALDPGMPFAEIHTLAEEVDASAAGERLTATLASIFGALAAILAAAGIYGLLAYMVAQRRREIGIRMALGAQPGDIGGLIGRETLAMAVCGIVVGLGATLACGSWIRALLYGIEPSDPASLMAAAAFVAIIALLATAVPVMRAIRVDPVTDLRQEN